MMAANIQIDFLNQIMLLNGLDFSQNSNFPVPVADVVCPVNAHVCSWFILVMKPV